jgi:TolB-like protein
MEPFCGEKLKAVWGELRRRKVFQVALVYIVMAWGVMQAGDLLFDALQVPEGSYTLLVILVLLGFPVAVVLAWAYEITPSGVRRDIVQELRSEAYRLAESDCGCSEPGERCRRLAILPFRDMAPGHDQDYFCEGLAEEIQSALCACDDLEVVARAHSAGFGGKKLDVERIRRELRVDALVEGSVRRYNGQYRVSVQLVDIRNGVDIWVRSFDLPTTSEFEVQKWVAAEVARGARQTFFDGASEEPVESPQLTLGYLATELPAGGEPGARH